MGNKGLLGGIAAALLLISTLSPVASAQPSEAQDIASLIVRYRAGVSPIASNGQPTGANLLGQRAELVELGDGLFALNLQRPVSKGAAKRLAELLAGDARVLFAEPDILLRKATVDARSFLAPASRVLRAASAPTGLSISKPLNTVQPSLPQLRLRWEQPANLFGAAVIGYRIQYSLNGGISWSNHTSNTGTNSTTALLTTKLTAGVRYLFRVRAITTDGTRVKVGSASSALAAKPRTTPRPVALFTTERAGAGSVRFIEQGLSDRGGYSISSVSYSAKAVAPDGTEVFASSCNSYRCNFPDLQDAISYRIVVYATNPRGTTDSDTSLTPQDEFFSYQWPMLSAFGISMPQAWEYSLGSKASVVAVIDTGIVDHPELTSSVLRNSDGTPYGYDFVTDLTSAADGDGRDANPTDMGGDEDDGTSSWHGTTVAGLIAARQDSIGISGMAPASRVLAIRALGRTGGALKDLLASINWAAGISVEGAPTNRYPAKVINLSLGSIGSSDCPQSAEEVIAAAIARGVTVVAAAGNGSTDGATSFPGNCKGVISVAATSSLGDRAAYSNFGDSVTISAPGGDSTAVAAQATEAQGMIITTSINDAGEVGYGLSEGTSMAAPIVSAIVSQMYAVRPTITPTQVRNILTSSVRPFAVGGICWLNGGCGTGIVNAHLALARVSALN